MFTRRFLGVACAAVASTAALVFAAAGGPATAAPTSPRLLSFANAAGQVSTFNMNGELDRGNPFFQDLGTNGRSCVTCHQPSEAWTITPEGVRARLRQSGGADPIFRNNDGSNCEGVVTSSVAEQEQAYSLLLTRGLIRVGLDVPEGADFGIDSVSDPYACGPGTSDASLYRRPLPSANLRFLSALMWDLRESFATSTIEEDLTRQANNATRGHAAAFADLTPGQARQIVELEMGLFTAQSRDREAGNLHAQGARGGPAALSVQDFFIGINDPVGLNPSGAPFTPEAFTLFDAWTTLPAASHSSVIEQRRAIGRGQTLFNTKPITLAGVGGLNGQTFSNGVTLPESFVGTCTICHDTPNAGNHSVKAPLDIGLTAPAVAPYLPVYTLRNRQTGETIDTTDPGRAMITGRWRDVNRFKGPILRGLAARAPYFHNGSAATLDEVVEFYDTRFGIGLTAREQADLVAFLRAL
jgi:hypothetical protein